MIWLQQTPCDESAVYAACDLLASTPLASHVRADLAPRPVHFWNVPRFPINLIVYDPASCPLTILRVLHGARDAAHELQR